MKVLLAGDTHGNERHMRRLFTHAASVGAERIIQVGDFGFGWEWEGVDDERRCTFTTRVSTLVQEHGIELWWLDGNHENFDLLELELAAVSVADDGTYELRPGVRYLPRGSRPVITGVRALVCGGGVSIDRRWRTAGTSWWPQEVITEADVARCRESGTARVLLSHDMPWEVTVIDRHMADSWGEEIRHGVYTNRTRLSQVLVACGADLVVHGHLHHRYDEWVRVGDRSVLVRGLDCDDTPMEACTMQLELRGGRVTQVTRIRVM